jgi:hypothetical protein
MITQYQELPLMESLPTPESGRIFLDFCNLLRFVAPTEQFYERALVVFAKFFARITVRVPIIANSAGDYIGVFARAAENIQLSGTVKQLCARARDVLSQLYPQRQPPRLPV